MDEFFNHYAAYQSLPDIDDVDEISDFDTDCLVDIKEIVDRHGVSDRIGLCVLHNHFPLEPGEIFIETVSYHPRLMMTMPALPESLEKKRLVPAMWKLDQAEPQVVMYRVLDDDDEKDRFALESHILTELQQVLIQHKQESRLGPCLIHRKFFSGLRPDQFAYEITRSGERASILGIADWEEFSRIREQLLMPDKGKKTVVTFDSEWLAESAPELLIHEA